MACISHSTWPALVYSTWPALLTAHGYYSQHMACTVSDGKSQGSCWQQQMSVYIDKAGCQKKTYLHARYIAAMATMMAFTHRTYVALHSVRKDAKRLCYAWPTAACTYVFLHVMQVTTGLRLSTRQLPEVQCSLCTKSFRSLKNCQKRVFNNTLVAQEQTHQMN